MSTVRLSVLRDTVYGTTEIGDIDLDPYTRRRRLGEMEALPEGVLAAGNSFLSHYLDHALETAASDLQPDSPVVVMVHGFLFDPKQKVSADPGGTDNPHGRLFHYVDGDEHEEQRHHTSSWPLHLGFDPDDKTGRSGLAVAFGWQSQPGFASSLINHFQNFYARAYDNGGKAAWVLVNVLKLLAEKLPNNDIHLMCHSLGSRVVIRALAQALKPERNPETRQTLHSVVERIGQVVLLGGAEYVVEAQLMMRRVMAAPLNRQPQFYNVASRENDVLDKLGENFGPRTFGNSQVIGHNGLDTSNPAENWIDLQIDGGDLQAWMQTRNIDVSGDRPGNVWDHWYYYTYRNNMKLYREILRQPGDWDIAALRALEIPEGVPRRWWNFGD